MMSQHPSIDNNIALTSSLIQQFKQDIKLNESDVNDLVEKFRTVEWLGKQQEAGTNASEKIQLQIQEDDKDEDPTQCNHFLNMLRYNVVFEYGFHLCKTDVRLYCPCSKKMVGWREQFDVIISESDMCDSKKNKVYN